MKTAVALLALAAAVFGRSIDYDDAVEKTTAYNYIQEFGIPLANAIRETEEAESRGEVSRIVGGSPSTVGQFPYQAGLIVHSNRGQGACGGSLLTTNRVLTAAHCWWDGRTQAFRFTVVLGSVRLFSGGVRMDTTDIVIIQGWDTRTLRNDIGMIRLRNRVTLSNTISTIPTPSGTTEFYSGERATASGFGITRDGTQVTQSAFLSHVRLDVMPNSVCARTPDIGGMVHASHLCTSGRGGVGICGGDSGGPLTVNRNGRPLLIAVSSFGHRAGCSAGHPDVYTRLTAFALFIRQNT